MNASLLSNTTARFLRENLPLIVAVVVHALIFQFLFAHGYDSYWSRAENVFNGLVPYRDFTLEYPPLSLAVLLAPRLFGTTYASYGQYLCWEMLIVDVLVLVLLAAISRRLGRSQWQVMAVYTAFILALGSISAQRYDLFPALFMVLAVYGFVSRRFTLAWVALALGVGAKLTPAALLPLLALFQLVQKDYRGLFKGMAVFAVIVLVTFLPWAIIAPKGLADSFTYHFSRGLQIETTWSSWLMLGQVFGWVRNSITFAHGAFELVSPAANALVKASGPLLIGGMLVVYAVYLRRLLSARGRGRAKGMDSAAWGNEFLVYGACVTLVFIAAGKVLSPQFLLWLCPLVALIGGRRKWWVGVIFLAALGATQYLYPHTYRELQDFKPAQVAVLAFRNALLIVLAVLLPLWQSRESPPKRISASAGKKRRAG